MPRFMSMKEALEPISGIEYDLTDKQKTVVLLWLVQNLMHFASKRTKTLALRETYDNIAYQLGIEDVVVENFLSGTGILSATVER